MERDTNVDGQDPRPPLGHESEDPGHVADLNVIRTDGHHVGFGVPGLTHADSGAGVSETANDELMEAIEELARRLERAAELIRDHTELIRGLTTRLTLLEEEASERERLDG